MRDRMQADPGEITRELYDALMDARPYVYNRLMQHRSDAEPARVETAERILERVDAALADAADYLNGGNR